MDEPNNEGLKRLNNEAYQLRYMLKHDEALKLVEMNKECLQTTKVIRSFVEATEATVIFLVSSLTWKITMKNWSGEQVVIEVPNLDIGQDDVNHLIGGCHYSNLAEKAGSEISIIEENSKLTFSAIFANGLQVAIPIELDDYTKAVVQQCLPSIEKVSHVLECMGNNAKLDIFAERDQRPMLNVNFETQSDMLEFDPIGSSVYTKYKFDQTKELGKFSFDRERALFYFTNRKH